MSKHTPGPWVVDEHAYDEELGTIAISAPGWSYLARVVIQFEGDAEEYPEGLANARLIASAPELLDALLELDAMYRRIAPDDPDGLHPSLHPAWKACKSAIAKATGETP